MEEQNNRYFTQGAEKKMFTTNGTNGHERKRMIFTRIGNQDPTQRRRARKENVFLFFLTGDLSRHSFHDGGSRKRSGLGEKDKSYLTK